MLDMGSSYNRQPKLLKNIYKNRSWNVIETEPVVSGRVYMFEAVTLLHLLKHWNPFPGP